MAHFYGCLKGTRGEATRLGGKKSGLVTRAASWQGAVRTELWEEKGVDFARVELVVHHGAGSNRVLYEGPVSGKAA